MISASEMVQLKQAIKSELARRSGYGSLAAYAGSGYDFSQTPASNQPITVEQGQKTVDLLLRIKDHGDLIFTKSGVPIPDSLDRNLLSYVQQLGAENVNSSTTNCRGACTGFCVGSCTGQCNGCSGHCNTGCMGCSASCGSGCSSGCSY